MSDTITFRARNNREVEVLARLWNEAVARTETRGDGRLGADDAEALFAIVAMDGVYSDLEKRTIKHIRAHFRWTPKGNQRFRSLVRAAAASGWGDSGFETMDLQGADGKDVQVAAALWVEATLRTEGQGDGRLGVEDAQALFELINADGEYSDLEKKTIRRIRRHFRWTPKGDETFRALVRAAIGKRGWTDQDVTAILDD